MVCERDKCPQALYITKYTPAGERCREQLQSPIGEVDFNHILTSGVKLALSDPVGWGGACRNVHLMYTCTYMCTAQRRELERGPPVTRGRTVPE